MDLSDNEIARVRSRHPRTVFSKLIVFSSRSASSCSWTLTSYLDPFSIGKYLQDTSEGDLGESRSEITATESEGTVGEVGRRIKEYTSLEGNDRKLTFVA